MPEWDNPDRPVMPTAAEVVGCLKEYSCRPRCSPALIETAIWYYYSPAVAGDFRNMAGDTKANCEELVRAGLLKETKGAVTRRYEPTDGLAVYIRALGEVPFPKLKWVQGDA